MITETGATEQEQGYYNTKKEPRKSLSVFLRNQNKMYVNSFNMIDRKAAIMIRVNATIISGIVIFFEHVKNIQFGTFIGVTLIAFCFVSLMFAINASRPHTFSLLKHYKNKIEYKYPNLEQNIFGIGLFDKASSLQEYEEAFNKLVSSQELQVGNQVRTMYIFEKLIKRAFKQIEVAYTAFMIGFTIVVITFIIASLQHLI